MHEQEVPGTAVMAQRRDRIRYVYPELPRGAELRLVTEDADALRAIHEFMAFQRDDHRAGGMDHHGMDHGATHGEHTSPPTGGHDHDDDHAHGDAHDHAHATGGHRHSGGTP